LNCDDISFREFSVIGSDPHDFDGDNDGIGCDESDTGKGNVRGDGGKDGRYDIDDCNGEQYEEADKENKQEKVMMACLTMYYQVTKRRMIRKIRTRLVNDENQLDERQKVLIREINNNDDDNNNNDNDNDYDDNKNDSNSDLTDDSNENGDDCQSQDDFCDNDEGCESESMDCIDDRGFDEDGYDG
jgi:hypothetical protein